MPAIYIDFEQTVIRGDISAADTNGEAWEAETYVIPVCVPVSEVAAWLAAYDDTNQYSPNATDSRIIARAVLDALKRAVDDG